MNVFHVYRPCASSLAAENWIGKWSCGLMAHGLIWQMAQWISLWNHSCVCVFLLVRLLRDKDSSKRPLNILSLCRARWRKLEATRRFLSSALRSSPVVSFTLQGLITSSVYLKYSPIPRQSAGQCIRIRRHRALVASCECVNCEWVQQGCAEFRLTVRMTLKISVQVLNLNEGI